MPHNWKPSVSSRESNELTSSSMGQSSFDKAAYESKPHKRSSSGDTASSVSSMAVQPPPATSSDAKVEQSTIRRGPASSSNECTKNFLEHDSIVDYLIERDRKEAEDPSQPTTILFNNKKASSYSSKSHSKIVLIDDDDEEEIIKSNKAEVKEDFEGLDTAAKSSQANEETAMFTNLAFEAQTNAWAGNSSASSDPSARTNNNHIRLTKEVLAKHTKEQDEFYSQEILRTVQRPTKKFSRNKKFTFNINTKKIKES